MTKTRFFSFINAKGGVLKTSCCFNIGSELAKRGYKVLLIDLDGSQSSLSISAGIDDLDDNANISDVMLSFAKTERVQLEDVIIKLNDNLSICTTNVDLMAADLILNSVISRETILKRALAPVISREVYDFIFIDCQPSLGFLPLNALTASTHVIVPCALTYLSYRGLNLIMDTLNQVQVNLNPELKLYGVIGTLENRTKHASEIKEQLYKNYRVLGIIPTGVVGQDALYEAKSVGDYAPKSKVAEAYFEIVDGMEKDLKGKTM